MRVRAMVRTRPGAAALDGVDCELVRGDVTDPASLRAAARGMRTIVHLVAIIEGSPADVRARDGGGHRQPRRGGARERCPPHRADERARDRAGRDRPVLPCQMGGRAGGRVVRSSTTPCSARASSSAPTEARCRASLRIARLAPVTPVIGPGTQRVQPIWIDDLVRAVRLAVEAEGTGTPVELGGPEAVTWSELWRRLKTALGTRRPAVHVPFWLARGPAALLRADPAGAPDARPAADARGTGQRRHRRRRVDAPARARRARRPRRAAPPRGGRPADCEHARLSYAASGAGRAPRAGQRQLDRS